MIQSETVIIIMTLTRAERVVRAEELLARSKLLSSDARITCQNTRVQIGKTRVTTYLALLEDKLASSNRLREQENTYAMHL